VLPTKKSSVSHFDVTTPHLIPIFGYLNSTICHLLSSTCYPPSELMPQYRNFEDLPAWQEAARLYNHVLDMLQRPSLPLRSSFWDQLDRAALSISNNIAEGFERISTSELITFLGYARGSAGEVRSMLRVVATRPELKPYARELITIRDGAENCARQIGAWIRSIEQSPIRGKRHLHSEPLKNKQLREQRQNSRTTFLRTLKPSHPLYNSSEAREARGEPPAE